MIRGKFNLVIDGQFGSTGKGAIAGYLANRHRPEVLSTTNMANAGHTIVSGVSIPWVAKALPSPSILRTWYPNYNPTVMVGPGAAFHLDRLLQEAVECCLGRDSLFIHPRAGVITDKHKQIEADMEAGTKHLASTMQGCGAFLSDKIMRRKSLKLAGAYEELAHLIMPGMSMNLMNWMDCGETVLHEGSQGFSLDINHGHSYPHCTSRQTTALQSVADMGIGPRYIGDIYMVLRPYPIRVGNISENGQTVGYSGGWYPDQEETTWDQVAQAAGMPEDEASKLTTRELTTVTKRLRRVATFSDIELRSAAKINGATKIALNFANYISWEVSRTNDPERLTPKVWDFIKRTEDISQVKVALVGTGPQLDHVVEL